MGTRWGVTELSENSLIEQWTTTVNGGQSDTAEGTITQAGQNDQANFVNIYGSYTPESVVLSGETKLKITKQYREDKTYDGDVTFTIAGLSGAPMPSRTSVTVSGADTASFGDITYTEPEMYRYTVAETQGNIDGMTWDGRVYTVTVTVRENQDEKKLEIESVSYTSSKEEDFTYGEDGMIFTNAYEAPVTTGTLTISKVVRKATDSEEDVDLTKAYVFTIGLTQEDGIPYEGTVPTENEQGEEGALVFADGKASVSLTHGTSIKLLELPDGAEWRVTEQSANARRFVQWTTTVNGERSNTADGTIAAGQDARANFVNIFGSYTSKSATLPGSTDLKITKRYDEADDIYSAKMYFTIEAVDDAPLPATTTVSVTEADAASFGDIVFEEAGTYQYTIREKSASIEGMTQDDTVYTVSVTVTEDQDARQLVIESVSYESSTDEAFAYGEDGMVFTNRYEKPEETTGALKISKTIGGKGADEDAVFRFRIKIRGLAGEYDGVMFENGAAMVRIQAGDSLTIEDLPAGLSYSVKELNSSGYKVTYENEKGTIVAGETIEVSIHNEKTSSSGGSSGGGTPSLNTKDHYAYIIGYEDGTVQPDGNITRAEVATIFFRLLRDEVRTEYWSQTNSYSDVAATDWFNNAVSTLSKMGIISGYPDGSFRPNAPITRAELTKIAAGFFADDRVTKAYDGRFSDVSGSEWYSEALMKAIEEGLIYGYPDGTFGPNRFITRAETCTIVNRTLGRGPHKDHLLPTQTMIVWPDNRCTSAWYYAQMQEATNSHDYTWTTDQGERVENWTGKLEERDWAALERTWSNANSAPGGEVMQ